jgi:NAD(P)-dependent dehydrogenase (short-subunit alcohol dehydrogenase family)
VETLYGRRGVRDCAGWEGTQDRCAYRVLIWVRAARPSLQVTSAALRNGARVIATSIDSSTAAANCEKLAGDLPHPNVKCVGLDLSSFTAVKGVAAAIAAETKVVDVLVNVAATMVCMVGLHPLLLLHPPMLKLPHPRWTMCFYL